MSVSVRFTLMVFLVLAALLGSCRATGETPPKATRMSAATLAPTTTMTLTAASTLTASQTVPPAITPTSSFTPLPTETPLPPGMYEMTLYELPGFAARFTMPPSEWRWESGDHTLIADGVAIDRFSSELVENCEIVTSYKQIMDVPVGVPTEVPESEFAGFYGEELQLGSHYFYWRSMSNETDVTLVYLFAAEQGEPTYLEFIALAPQNTWETECKPLVRAVLAAVEVVPE